MVNPRKYEMSVTTFATVKTISNKVSFMKSKHKHVNVKIEFHKNSDDG